MRVVFMGTPEFAVPTLDALVAAGHDVVAVYSQPPRPAGRGKKLQPSPVHLAAERHGLPVLTPVSLKGADEQAAFAAHGADVAVVAAYGLILPAAILAAPAKGCLNVHGSLLPRWRGAAPVQRAILAGDVHTGITIMQMERGLDTGPMLATVATPVAGKTAGALTAELATLGADLMVRVLADLASFTPEVQPEAGVTYAAKIDKAESRLDFAQPAEQVERQVRAFAPAPGAFFELDGERYRVLAAQVADDAAGTPGTVLDEALTIACGQGAIRPLTVQRAGRPAMDTAALLRGRAIPAGTVLA
ncbi:MULTISPECIES: methionyl-tRNA formyltransferase [unclassified Novosphingobium]|uniref:methionyl-tRNA formyltransferase n=1 Tax=unclassified Novosphingobium TaxID=2644732 RepID=UPI001494B900|nr:MULTISPECIES: methionyl-tRNA formyltransferase [unclassified Novosphingobium]MBB3359648.1 methionyl-tRNA formyltransferase [Novosphingobium sp. BK256]MBB3375986.1 methionyl-tRNA formyltransferase [Novosphingobium sp. BK280]MBB3380421.1 methionyl-tRNA formyltransferase [Novosphingobium sp. BK258]MBB3422073.1 methionyl-tRNA formyltransferase [Novosphingobium sp. BK267]MBB3450750.1 methionyl-tRNA formyltransferase [Novosphingobium sp. BK352]